MANKKHPVIFVEETGTRQAPRYVISDQYERVWNGQAFTDQRDEAVLYASQHQAETDTHEVLKQLYQVGTPRTFVAPVVIDVYQPTDIHEAEVMRYLIDACHLYIDSPTYGNGPRGGLLLPRIEWHHLKESHRQEHNDGEATFEA